VQSSHEIFGFYVSVKNINDATQQLAIRDWKE